MNNLVEFLENGITKKMALDNIVNVFEKMCDIPMENDMILFETGTFSFTGEPMFQFSLVRQFPNEDEEYFQVHLDVLYNPTSENKVFSETTWNDEINGNIFDYIRKSQTFASCRNKEYVRIETYLDET